MTWMTWNCKIWFLSLSAWVKWTVCTLCYETPTNHIISNLLCNNSIHKWVLRSTGGGHLSANCRLLMPCKYYPVPFFAKSFPIFGISGVRYGMEPWSRFLWTLLMSFRPTHQRELRPDGYFHEGCFCEGCRSRCAMWWELTPACLTRKSVDDWCLVEKHSNVLMFTKF